VLHLRRKAVLGVSQVFRSYYLRAPKHRKFVFLKKPITSKNQKLMKKLLLLLCFLQPMVCHSQFFVGDSKELVVLALKKSKAKYTENSLSDTTYTISWLKENQFQMIFILNIKDTVIRQTLIPESKNGLNEFIRWFNKDFVVISNSEWKNYENGRIYKIKLDYILREPLFSITLDP
jgi:hypothetical protein